jgi:uncharacterized membrane protein YkoI
VRGKPKRIVIAVSAIAALGLGGAAVARAVGGDDGTDQAITGPALERASKAALAEVGSGKVTDTEVRDEEGYYEVEVTRPDGSQVDVHLDEQFKVTGSKADNEQRDHGS